MGDDDPDVAARFERLIAAAEGTVTERMLRGDTRGGMLRTDPVYPPVGAVLEAGETPQYVVPGTEIGAKDAQALVATDRRVYRVNGYRTKRGAWTSMDTVRYADVRHVRGSDRMSRIVLQVGGDDGSTVDRGVSLHAEADRAEAERAVAYIAERRDAAIGGAGGGVVARLGELADLRDRGALTGAEFERVKADLLGSAGGADAGGGAGGDERDDGAERDDRDRDGPQGPTAEWDGPGTPADASEPPEDGPVTFTYDPPARLTRYQSFYERLGLPDDLPVGVGPAVERTYRMGCDRLDDPKQLRLLQEAYETLVDPDERERYAGMDHLQYLREAEYSA